jgi:sec-independent protein translocase protein TatA
MGRIGLGELIVIAIIAVLVLGAGRLSDIGKGLGEGIRNLKKGLRDDSDPADPQAAQPQTTQPQAPAQPQGPVAAAQPPAQVPAAQAAQAAQSPAPQPEAEKKV